jgi:hypothetical protein
MTVILLVTLREAKACALAAMIKGSYIPKHQASRIGAWKKILILTG